FRQHIDSQLGLSPHTQVRRKDHLSGIVDKQNGFGDTITGIKWNLKGNDDESTAIALTPFLKWPTSQDGLGTDSVEGGLAIPVAIALPLGCWLGLSPEVEVARDLHSSGY